MKKTLRLIVISLLSLAMVAGAFGTRASGTVVSGSSVAVPNGGQNVIGRGTEDNPFVILEIVPTVGSDSLYWNSSTSKAASFDNYQAMRWGVASEIESYNYLTDNDLLYNTDACEKLIDAGVVTGTGLTTDYFSSLDQIDSELQKYAVANGYVYYYYRFTRNYTSTDGDE